MFGCDACHTGETPTLLELDMNSGHTLCRGCHEEKGIGPTKCAGCHKK
jgi:predicted CXXCH cytochrome family protein